MTVPNTAVSAAVLGAIPETVLEVVGLFDVSAATRTALVIVVAVTAACPGTEKVGAGDTASVLTSGTPVAAGVASAEGAARLALDAMVVELLTAGWARTGSFLTESEVCRGDWESWADCCCPRGEGIDAATSLLPGFSGRADDVTSSVFLPEDTGWVVADAELRRLPSDNAGNDAGRAVAVVADGGTDGVTALPVCWLPNEKLALPPLKEVPPKLITPEEAALVSGRLPKTPVEELLVLVLAAAGDATVVEVMEEVTGGSTCFPNTGGPVKLNPEGPVEVLVVCALVRLVEEALLADFVESSAWPTRNPEKLPRVSPAREFGNRKSPNFDEGVSSLLEAVGRAIPEGATSLLLDGTNSPEEATAAPAVFDADVIPEGGGLSGVVS